MSRENPFRFLITSEASEEVITPPQEITPFLSQSENITEQMERLKPTCEGYFGVPNGEKEGGQGDTPRMAFYGQNGHQKPHFSVRTQDGKNYRIWLCAQYEFTPTYINQLCRFLDTRESSETVTIHLGANLCDEQCTVVGSIIAAIDDCRAHVTVVANAACGITETMIFCFAPHREMRKYATLQFGGYALTEVRKDQTYFLDAFFQRGVDLKLLTEEERDTLVRWQTTKTIYPEEYAARTSAT